MHDVETAYRQGEPSVEPRTERPPKRRDRRRRWGGRLLALGAFLLLGGGLAFGATRYYAQQRQVMATAEQRRNFIPSLRVAMVRPSDRVVLVTLPATTLAFSAANLYARASGYIDKRLVDIGDRVKAGQLLAAISAPELDYQKSQNEHTLAQLRESLLQAQANLELAKITWDRDRPLVGQGWAT
jgi:multidrug efflux pump subunit AcrA (membrane-fusion protein)